VAAGTKTVYFFYVFITFSIFVFGAGIQFTILCTHCFHWTIHA